MAKFGAVFDHGSPNHVPSPNEHIPQKSPISRGRKSSILGKGLSCGEASQKTPQPSLGKTKAHARQGLHQALSCHALFVPGSWEARWPSEQSMAGWKATSTGNHCFHQ